MKTAWMGSVAMATVAMVAMAPAAMAAEGAGATPTTQVREADEARPAGFDIEVDPIAYVFGGHSLHVGFGWGRVRLDLGAFGMDVPTFFHGNEGVDIDFAGFGVKADVFLSEDRSGPFAGLGAGLVTMHTRDEASSLSREASRAQVGARIGYLLDLAGGFYVTPWVSVDHVFGGGDFELAGKTVKDSEWVVFPTVHLGFRM